MTYVKELIAPQPAPKVERRPLTAARIAGVAILAQANAQPQSVLALLQ